MVNSPKILHFRLCIGFATEVYLVVNKYVTVRQQKSTKHANPNHHLRQIQSTKIQIRITDQNSHFNIFVCICPTNTLFWSIMYFYKVIQINNQLHAIRSVPLTALTSFDVEEAGMSFGWFSGSFNGTDRLSKAVSCFGSSSMTTTT